LEVAYRYNDFAHPLLTNSDFEAKPMVMLLGQYSTGKTTFIKHLLKTSYPGAHVGPEPTTDRFIVVMSGSDGRGIPRNTIVVLLRYAINVHEAPNVLVGMTNQCLVISRLLSATEVDTGPWPPPLENKYTWPNDTMTPYCSLDLPFGYG
jgi:energy-coupling factor transporter ATP-binding protein EcfA2